MKNFGKILWGVVLIVLGVIVGSNALGFTDIDIFFKGWWTLFIIVPCAIGIFSDDDKTGNLIGLAIGVFLFLGVRDLISFELIGKMIFPVILVIIGLSLVFNEAIKGHISSKVREKNGKNAENIIGTFAEQKVDKSNETFECANMDAVFGSAVLDLRNAKLKKEATIKASAIFGGVTILVPEDVNIKIKSTPIFGGVSNKAKTTSDSKTTIYIDAFCMFGGVEIK